jgi:hypothetical protein
MSLKTGTYRALGSMYARSYRVVANQGSRVCLKIVNGPPNPYEGYENITVSSVSARDGQLFVDATGEDISINTGSERLDKEDVFYFIIVDGRSGVWQHTKDDFESDELIDECLSSMGQYEKTVQGRFITGLFSSPSERKGKLVATDPAAQINVRTGPGTSYDSPHYGVVGDKVILTESGRERDAQDIWYKVKFAGSGASAAEGWIRSDFIQQEKSENNA